MRDKETIDTALKAAETGHLVISTVHTKNAVQTISRLIAMFDPSEQDMIRVRLSEQLQAVISQRLIPGPRMARDGLLHARSCPSPAQSGTASGTPAGWDEIYDLIEEGSEQYGSQSFDQHLLALVKSDQIDFRVAMAAANNPTDFDLKVNTFGPGGSGSTAGAPPAGLLRRDVSPVRRLRSPSVDLSGVHVPLATPFDPVTGDFDPVGLCANVRTLQDSGVHGFVVAGSTGEAVLLDEEERRTLLEAARAVVAGDRLLLAGVGAESTRMTVRMTRTAAQAGADAVLVMPPAFYRAAMTPEATTPWPTHVRCRSWSTRCTRSSPPSTSRDGCGGGARGGRAHGGRHERRAPPRVPRGGGGPPSGADRTVAQGLS